VDPTRFPNHGELAFLRVGANAIHIGRFYEPRGKRKSARFFPITPGNNGPVKEINLTRLLKDVLIGNFHFEIFPITKKIHPYTKFRKKISIQAPILEKNHPLGSSRAGKAA
jgi:hypothetical protein